MTLPLALGAAAAGAVVAAAAGATVAAGTAGAAVAAGAAAGAQLAMSIEAASTNARITESFFKIFSS